VIAKRTAQDKTVRLHIDRIGPRFNLITAFRHRIVRALRRPPRNKKGPG
jgi:hypothetical protein